MLRPILVAPESAPTVDDAGIEEALRLGFAPYRCVVEFQDGGTKVALHVYGRNGRDFAVIAKQIDSLRDPVALAQYIRDVRYVLRQRKLSFDILQP
jgi:hypothetical protein